MIFTNYINQIGEKIPLRQLSRGVMVYMLIAFSWWAVNLWRANERAFATEYALLQAKMGANKNGVNITQLQETVEYKSIEKKYHSHHRMIVYEGVFFMGCLIFGLWMINRSANREVSLARQRQNFLLSITHELKSPLAGMKLVFETLNKRELNREQTQKLCDNGIKESNRLNNLIQDLLLAARLEDNWKPLQEPCNLLELTKEIKDGLLARFPETRIQLDIPENFSRLNADKQGIHAILQNLMENAIKYSPEPAKLTVSAQRTPKNTTCIKIADEGIGIADVEKKLVFDKFYRSGNEETRNTKGTGLGLYIVAQVVKAHGGTVKITDNTPKGTVFTIEI